MCLFQVIKMFWDFGKAQLVVGIRVSISVPSKLIFFFAIVKHAETVDFLGTL